MGNVVLKSKSPLHTTLTSYMEFVLRMKQPTTIKDMFRQPKFQQKHFYSNSSSVNGKKTTLLITPFKFKLLLILTFYATFDYSSYSKY
jgi:hypothetical protein